MIEVRECSLIDTIDRITDLMQANWDETGYDFEFNPNVDFYKKLDAAGLLLAVGAFDGDEVVGYSLSTVIAHPFNNAVRMCNADVLFLRKDHRGTKVGARLMSQTERLAKERGAHRMLWHARGGTNLAEVLKKRGYTLADEVMMKGL